MRLENICAHESLKKKWIQILLIYASFLMSVPLIMKYFVSTEQYFACNISTILTSHMQHFPFPACRGKGTPQWTPKVSDTKGCMTLGHSSWSIWSLQNLS